MTLGVKSNKQYLNVLDFIGNYEKAGRTHLLFGGGEVISGNRSGDGGDSNASGNKPCDGGDGERYAEKLEGVFGHGDELECRRSGSWNAWFTYKRCAGENYLWVIH